MTIIHRALRSLSVLRKLAAMATIVALVSLTAAARGAEPSQRVRDLLEQMTLEEKAGQMTQVTLEGLSATEGNLNSRHTLSPEKVRQVLVERHVGSVLNNFNHAFTPEYWREVVGELQGVATSQTRLGIPLIYGVDSVHGANYVRGATIFPHSLSLAASFNPDLALEAGRITARQTRGVGIPWNFAPIADVMRHPAWSRVFETFGEDPYLVSRMSEANVRGMQGDSLAAPASVVACGKHFLGYSLPRSGRDRTPSSLSDHELHDVFVPPFRAMIDAGLGTMMVNSGSINGVPVHASERLLKGLLRESLGFEGVVVTDWEDVIKLRTFHKVAATDKDAIVLAVDAGIDMSMTPYNADFAVQLAELVREGRISESRLDESVLRILSLKEQLGLFESPMPPAPSGPIATEADAAVNFEAARQSLVLLRNTDGLLPLKQGARLLVAGPAADSLPAVHGAWTYTWQGTEPGEYPDTPTVADALRELFGEQRVALTAAQPFGHTYTEAELSGVTAAARRADAVVLCLGERPSTEQMGNIDDLRLDAAQVALAKAAGAAGKPVILVMISNRPRLITEIEAMASAVIWAGHPGTMGPQALAELLAGSFSPSGRLPFTYPRHPNALLTYDHTHADTTGLDPSARGFDPMFEFGSGLSYTTFTTSALRVTRSQGGVSVSVDVRNTGGRAGAEVVQLYISDEVASIVPAVKRLRGFDRVELDAGASATVTFELGFDDFAMVTETGDRRVEPGAFTLRIGTQQAAVEISEQQARDLAAAARAGGAGAEPGELVWSDEFDTLDLNVWQPQIGDGSQYGIPGWGNNELQYYTDRPKNLRVENGELIIEAHREDMQGKPYTSARIHTPNTAMFLYKRIEARIKVPATRGIWPAFWMLPTDWTYGGWPLSGEIDIMEVINDADELLGTIHFGSAWPNNKMFGNRIPVKPSLSENYHVYRVDWYPDRMEWFFDGKRYHVARDDQWFTDAAPDDENAPFDQPFHLLLNVAVGGNLPGNPDATSRFPVQMRVDWVRVYELGN